MCSSFSPVPYSYAAARICPLRKIRQKPFRGTVVTAAHILIFEEPQYERRLSSPFLFWQYRQHVTLLGLNKVGIGILKKIALM